VNNGQALKSAAVWFRQTGNDSFPPLSMQRMLAIDQFDVIALNIFVFSSFSRFTSTLKL
jgi:hypothetical protein